MKDFDQSLDANEPNFKKALTSLGRKWSGCNYQSN